MLSLSEVVNRLDNEFNIKSFGKNSAFSRFIPGVYEPLQFDWKSAFEKDFCELFNGLMIKGASNIVRVFLAVFPTDYVLERFIEESNEGDLLFMHHPLLIECGDPKGKLGLILNPLVKILLLVDLFLVRAWNDHRRWALDVFISID